MALAKFNLRVDEDLYTKIVLCAEAHGTSLNAFMVEGLERYTTHYMGSLSFKTALAERIAKQQAILDGVA